MCDVKMSNFEVATDMSGLLSLSCVEKKGGGYPIQKHLRL